MGARGRAGQPPGGRRAGQALARFLRSDPQAPVPRDAETRPERLASLSRSQRGRHRGSSWRGLPSPGGQSPPAAGAWTRTRRTRSGSLCCCGSPGPSGGRSLRGRREAETAAGGEGAASPSQASDRELPLLPRDASFLLPGLGAPAELAHQSDRNRPAGSGATRLFPTPRPARVPLFRRACIQAPPRVAAPGFFLSPASPCLVGKAVRQAPRPEHRPRVQLSLTPWLPRLFLPHPRSPVYSHLLQGQFRLLLLTQEVVIKLRSLGPPPRVILNF